jgi:hypothetical protein
LQLAYELCLAGVGGCASPEELFERLTDQEWAGWVMYARNFSTPMRRADLNSAMERQAVMAPHCQRGRVPSVSDLLPAYGGGRKAKKAAATLFDMAQAEMGAVVARQAVRKRQ